MLAGTTVTEWNMKFREVQPEKVVIKKISTPISRIPSGRRHRDTDAGDNQHPAFKCIV